VGEFYSILGAYPHVVSIRWWRRRFSRAGFKVFRGLEDKYVLRGVSLTVGEKEVGLFGRCDMGLTTLRRLSVLPSATL